MLKIALGALTASAFVIVAACAGASPRVGVGLGVGIGGGWTGSQVGIGVSAASDSSRPAEESVDETESQWIPKASPSATPVPRYTAAPITH